MKIVYLCQKHYNALMKEIKQVDPLPLGANINTGAIGYLYGEPVTLYIKKYLKKIRIIDTGQFKLQMPKPEFDIPDRTPAILYGFKTLDRIKDTILGITV